MTLNPYQGLKLLADLVQQGQAFRDNDTESLSGIETAPFDFKGLVGYMGGRQ
jgi:hypothetical protein